MVVVTDGGDTTSFKHYGDALAAAQRSDVVLYPIVVIPIAGDAGRNTGGEHALATLASSTGGRIFYPEGFDRLNEAFADIIRELRTQYMLGFYPKRHARRTTALSSRESFHQKRLATRDRPHRLLRTVTDWLKPGSAFTAESCMHCIYNKGIGCSTGTSTI